MFAKRGVRTLPRLVDEPGGGRRHDDDTKMLYDYLKELGGICASHTSATGMGTDWRDNDPKVEPIVEIYQGHRNSYEHLGRPAWPGGRARRSAAGSRYGHGLERPGDAVPARASRRRATTSRPTSAIAVALAEEPHPRGDPRRLQAAALLRARPTTSCSTSAAATT